MSDLQTKLTFHLYVRAENINSKSITGKQIFWLKICEVAECHKDTVCTHGF